MVKKLIYVSFFAILLQTIGCNKQKISHDNISGIYPHLAFYNNEGECGTGAVVPWANRLWVITYGPHLVKGSSDKLYELSENMDMTVRPESVGGTPANRLIHKESDQLFIGPYAIDNTGNIKVISYENAPGRYTGAARHLTDPENKIYIATMEEGFYEIDVKTLETKTLYEDANSLKGDKYSKLLPGVHGKGLYSGQGVLVYSNNGENSQAAMSQFDVESGSLSEWDGKDWKVVRRNQFVEITGKGGIHGNEAPDTDPIWATGWDHKSILLGVRHKDTGWAFYRLPKGSNSYDGAHGWNTEWPRIRNVGDDTNEDYLMTMHGTFWRFPSTFTANNSSGIRPRSSYLKVIGDFARWNDKLVFGCDDSAQKEFLNKRKAKGDIEGPGQSNSNLWFTSFTTPDELGPATANGSVWANEAVKAGEYSDPFIFTGWDERCAWIKNGGTTPSVFTLEVDIKGDNKWGVLRDVKLAAGESVNISFNDSEKGEWVRVKSDKDVIATVSFNYSMEDKRALRADSVFNGLASVEHNNVMGGLLYSLPNNRRSLAILANITDGNNIQETGYYEMSDKLELIRKEDDTTSSFIRDKFKIASNVIKIDEGSILIVDDKARRWRLPLGNSAYNGLTNGGLLRVCREVATERDLFNCHGTFYELPAENADGYAKMRPVATHNFRINDYASYRGMMILTGIKLDNVKDNPHIVVSDDNKAAVWVGAIDDLWKLGKPIGYGGPLKNTAVKKGEVSDPYLIAFYDNRSMKLSHDSSRDITFKVEVDPTGNGDWMEYMFVNVDNGKEFKYDFPKSFNARWIRFSTNADTKATAWLEYK